MTTTTPEQLAIPDEEIREWARATGRKVSERGKVGAALRAEYQAQAAQLGASVDAGDPPAERPEAGPAPDGPQAAPERPRAARAETRPRAVKTQPSGLGARAKAWFSGGAPAPAAGKKPAAAKAKAEARPRTPVTRLVERVWNQAARVTEFANVPVARTMAWQSPYVGVVVEDVIAGTPLDKILQPLARAEGAVTGVGAMIAMPILVGLITAERNDPETHGLVAIARQQMLHAALDECIDSQLEMFGSRDLASKIAKSAEQQAARSAEVEAIRGMIFAPIPQIIEVPEDATAEQLAAAQAQSARNEQTEMDLRAAAAAVRFMRVPAEPDMRGQAAEQAAASMAAAGNAAAAAQAAQIAAIVDARPMGA